MRTVSFYLGIFLIGNMGLQAQDCGKIVISNAQKSDPLFIVSMNGVRLNNDYAQTVTFKCVDETQYRVKILQAGYSSPINFTISSEPNYTSSYLLLKDNAGHYSLLLKSKNLMLDEKEAEPAVATPAAVVTAQSTVAVQANPGAPSSTVSQVPVHQGPVAIGEEAFRRKYNKVKSKSFDDEKIERIKDAFEYDHLKTSQVVELMKLFSFDDKRLETAKYCYKKTVDKENFYKTYDQFSFSSSKTQLKEWVSKNK